MGGSRVIRSMAVVLAVALSVVACADETRDANNGSGEDASDVMTADAGEDASEDAASDDTSTDDTGSSDATSGNGVPICRNPCQSASECGEPDEPLFNPDNHVCEAGVCVFTGCSSDAECVEGLGDGYECDDSGAMPTCQKTCSNVSDCTLEGSLNDQDNYSCNSGFCRFDGCNTDQECIDELGEGHLCAPAEKLPQTDIPSCTKACTSAADCGTPTDLYGEDNYACVGGACVWTGCNTSEECNGVVDRGLICQ